MLGVFMGFIEEYKELIEISNPTITDTDIVYLYSHYGISHEKGVYILRDVTDYLYKKIFKTLKCDGECELSSYLIRKIKDHFLLEHFFSGSSLEPYYTLEVIFDAVRTLGNIISFDKKDKWKKVIEAALDYNIISLTFKKPSSLKKNNPRIYNLANAAKYFKKKGYDVTIKDAEVNIKERDLKKICDEIEDTIRLLGGVDVVYNLLNQFSGLFDKELDRFNLNRINGFGNYPLVPIGYLLNLAAKHAKLTQINDTLMWNYYYKYLIQISGHLGATYNVQPYNMFQLLFKGPINIIEFIQEIAIFDSMFSLIQLRPSDVPRILKGLFSSINPKEMEKEIGFNLDHLIMVTNKILNLAKSNIKPLIFEITDLNYKGDIKVLNKVLDVLSYDADIVNKDFILPKDKPNLIFKPLIKTNHKYVLLNRSWCSPMFYEALANELRTKKPWKHLEDDIIGPSLEEFIKSEFNNHNIKCRSGHYKIGKIEGQCDVIIESKDTIVFIEVKKKSLTRESKSGDEITLILDLSKSLLDAQIQTGKHEILLRENGYIEFDDKTRLNFKDRTIERVALTLLDYGGFQDRQVINQLLKVISSVDFRIRISKYESDFEKVKKKNDEFREESKKLAVYDTTFNEFPFFNCWFLSLPQLLILIDDSMDNDSFVQQLKKVKSMGFLSLDFYYEYGKLRSLLK